MEFTTIVGYWLLKELVSKCNKARGQAVDFTSPETSTLPSNIHVGFVQCVDLLLFLNLRNLLKLVFQHFDELS